MSQNKKIIAITGGIGSGKSTVRHILSSYGEICFDCDEINRNLLSQPEYLIGLKKIFPSVFSDNKLKKEILKKLIFESENDRIKLNNYAHKEIKKQLLEIINKTNSNRIFVEIPILNQTDFLPIFDEVWVVIADKQTKMDRIVSRDHSSPEFIKQQFSSQTEENNYPIKTIQIFNNGTINELQNQIKNLL